MKYPKYEKEIATLLACDTEIDVKDFVGIFHDMPMTSVYARIRGLVEEGRLSVVGKGRYKPDIKLPYRVEITPWMKECNSIIIREMEGVNFCISERNGNLEVEVSKDSVDRTVDVLRRHYEKVMHRKDVKMLSGAPAGYVLVDRMVSEAPLAVEQGVEVPSAEKQLVDAVCRKESVDNTFQRMLEVHQINYDRLRRYASRRGVAEEVASQFEKLDRGRIEMFSRVRRYLAGTQVVRAWVFGSFARGEETASSDLDLLVEYDKTGGLSLLKIVRYQLDIEKLIGRKVDLVTNGCLKPFAQASAERDKYLIYAR